MWMFCILELISGSVIVLYLLLIMIVFVFDVLSVRVCLISSRLVVLCVCRLFVLMLG